jgi:hypothetical protein
MSKINLTYDKKEYILEYNRQSVKTMENQGFVLEELTKKPANMIPLLFAGAFIKNHSGKNGVSRKVIDEIFDGIDDKTALMEALMEMYADTLSTLTDSNGEGNVTWALVK